MAKVITYVCDRCGKETVDERELESYYPLEIERHYRNSSSYTRLGKVSGDVCKDCEKILCNKMKDFFRDIADEFHFNYVFNYVE